MSIVYAMIGIPLFLIVLNDLGKNLLIHVKNLSDWIGDQVYYIGWWPFNVQVIDLVADLKQGIEAT